MITSANIVNYDGCNLIVRPQDYIGRELQQKQSKYVEIRIVDGRTISSLQRRKVYALIRDIAMWNGDDPEWLKEYFKFIFCGECDQEYFSLSNCEKSIATSFITYLVDFCLYHNIPTRESLSIMTDDIGRYLYSCLEHKRCAVCNKPGEIHHVDRIGMGRDREQIVHTGLSAVCLCREHHTQCHNDEETFFNNNHIYGIKLDKFLCDKLNLNTKERK